jgi:hypothetical protein
VCESIAISWPSKGVGGRVSVRSIVGSKRIFMVGLASVSAFIGVVPGCANLIGLGDFGVTGGSATSSAGSANHAGESTIAEAGSGADAGTGPEGGSSGASTGGADSSAGRTGSAGSGGSGGSAGNVGSGGNAGVGGAACPSNCDDQNDCTVDSCVAGACKNEPLAAGKACGTGRTCDNNAVCVRCRDTAADKGQDEGCSAGAPVCTGTGTAATCAGCTKDADCDDGNECTTEKCTTGSCVVTPVAAGQACATGVCNGTANAEKCVACTDNAVAPSKDLGCSDAKPACDPSGTGICYACVKDADCASDNLSCTNETCANHLCTHVPDDSKCTPSGDVCKPNKCDSVVGCKAVDISTTTELVTSDSGTGNGSFESVFAADADGDFSAFGWSEFGTYFIIYDCSGFSCAGATGSTGPSLGSYTAWMGSGSKAGVFDSGVTELRHLMPLPLGATKLRVRLDTNFQTKSATVANHDSFQVRLLDSDDIQIGAALKSFSAVDAQTGAAHIWKPDAVDVTTDVSAQAGHDVYLSLWASVDTTLRSDFFFDNVRVTETICK